MVFGRKWGRGVSKIAVLWFGAPIFMRMGGLLQIEVVGQIHRLEYVIVRVRREVILPNPCPRSHNGPIAARFARGYAHILLALRLAKRQLLSDR